MAIKTGQELATACVNVAKNYKTLYVMGCFGAPLTASNKERYIQANSYNQKSARKQKIMAATSDTFGFDCVCLIKGLLWGWDGSASKTYGGASYCANNVPDIGADQIINKCRDVSTDFSKIAVGELLWMEGHVGIYIGNGQAVECTPSWKDCVQVTTVKNIKSGTGHKWTKHGKLPYVTYDASAAPAVPTTPTVSTSKVESVSGLPVLAYGSKGASVRALQILLIGNYCSCGNCGADGDFGDATASALEKFQREKSLEPDRVCGPQTWAKLLGV